MTFPEFIPYVFMALGAVFVALLVWQSIANIVESLRHWRRRRQRAKNK